MNIDTYSKGTYYFVKGKLCKYYSSSLKNSWCADIPQVSETNIKKSFKTTNGGSRISFVNIEPPVVQGNNAFVVDNGILFVFNVSDGNISFNVSYENDSLFNLVASDGNIFSIKYVGVNSVVRYSDDDRKSSLITKGKTAPVDEDLIPPVLEVFDSTGNLVKDITLSNLVFVTSMAVSNNHIYVLDSYSGTLTILSDIVSTSRGSPDEDLSVRIKEQSCDEGSETIFSIKGENGDDLSSARINLEGPRDYSGRTDSNGKYNFDLHSGTYVVTVSHSGYNDYSSSFTLDACPIIVEVGERDENKTEEPEDNETEEPEDDANEQTVAVTGTGSEPSELVKSNLDVGEDLYGSNDHDLAEGNILDTEVSEQKDSLINFKSTTGTFSWFIFLRFIFSWFFNFNWFRRS